MSGHEVIVVRDNIDLHKLIRDQISEHGWFSDLNHIDVRYVKDFSSLFYLTPFYGDISQWNMSSAINLKGMFMNSDFHSDISNWNVSNVTNMNAIFLNSGFTGDISKWNISKVEDLSHAFSGSHFNGDISNWNISDKCNISSSFSYLNLSPLGISNLLTDKVKMTTICDWSEKYFAFKPVVESFNLGLLESSKMLYKLITDDLKVENLNFNSFGYLQSKVETLFRN